MYTGAFMGSQPFAAAVKARALAFAEFHLGQVTQVRDLSWQHGESAVWDLHAMGARAVLKVYRQPRKYAQELTAYSEWLPLLRPRLPEGSAAPRLLGWDGQLRALLLSWEEGALLQRLSLTAADERHSHLRAGSFLRQLHSLPLADEDPLTVLDAYAKRVASWTRRATGIVPAALIAATEAAAMGAAPFLQGLRRVPCHRDYTPRNWLVGRDRRLTVIDFEHAHPDLYLVDLQRLWVGAWRRRPDLKEAFLEGYGRQLTADEERALRSISALWALSTIVWARQHHDATFEGEAWEVLRWLGLGGPV